MVLGLEEKISVYFLTPTYVLALLYKPSEGQREVPFVFLLILLILSHFATEPTLMEVWMSLEDNVDNNYEWLKYIQEQVNRNLGWLEAINHNVLRWGL